MKIGIYLGYGPKTLLHKEGLGRYLAVLIKGMLEREQQITVALPEWLLASFDSLAEDFNIDLDSIDFIVEYRTPVLWQIYDKLPKKDKRKKDLKKKLFLSSLKFGEKLAELFLSITNFFVLIVISAAILIFGLLLIPVGFFALLLYMLYYILTSIVRREKIRVKTVIKKIEALSKEMKGTGINFYSKIFQKILKNVQEKLVDRINGQNEKMDIWYSPSIFWPAFNKIQGAKVINVPDLVIMDFPLHWYNKPGMIESGLKCEQTIMEGSAFITYCDFIKNDLLIKRYAKNESAVRVIPHMVNDMSRYVNINAEIAAKNASPEVFTKAFCRTLLQQSARNVQYVTDYIKKFDFKSVRYIFYSSQVRPHKNMLNFLKAYSCVLRENYGGVKLFITGNLYEDEELKKYVLDNKLQYDVLCFYNVSAQQLAALYHEAELVVNPTLYEGGFPFTFSEGMSVGVPSVMSDIPQTREVFGDELDIGLFDPYDYRDIAKKIIWGISNRKLLFEKELPLYKKLCTRDVKQYIDEYIETFLYFS